MNLSDVITFVLGVLAILLVAGAIAFVVRSGAARSTRGRRTRAAAMREHARSAEQVIATRETEAAEAERAAEAARREAEMLEAGAEHLNAEAARLRAEQVAELAEADRIDPESEAKPGAGADDRR